MVALGTLVMTVIVAIAFALMMRTLAKGDEPDFRRRQRQRPPAHGANSDSNGAVLQEYDIVLFICQLNAHILHNSQVHNNRLGHGVT